MRNSIRVSVALAVLIALPFLSACSNTRTLMTHPETADQRVCGGTNTPALIGVIGGAIGSTAGYAIGEARANSCVNELLGNGYRYGS